ncbi:hypothetical protein Hanom_Chr08g00750431 [Helianthus anomalus]
MYASCFNPVTKNPKIRLFFQYILEFIKKKKPILLLFHRLLGTKRFIAGSSCFATIASIIHNYDLASSELPVRFKRLKHEQKTNYEFQDSNLRTQTDLFKNQTRPPDVLSDAILQTVRYKLMVVKFKNTVKVRELLGTWEIHDTPLNDE